MPTKKEKDRVYDDTYWRSIIEETPLNEESWQVKVMIFEIAGDEQEITYINRFENYAKEEKRFVVKNICKSETIFMINQLGGDKKIKDDNLRVFEEGYIFLKEKKDIPPDILALIIKHLILKMKEEYISIQRQKLVVRQGMRNESTIMIDKLEIKNNVPIKVVEPPVEPPSETTQTKSKGKKGEGDVQSPPPQPEEGKKYNTLLRERGEEWRDKVYVDDYPLDGPNLYVAITGFLEPYLLENLIKIDVPLTALVQIRIEPVSTIISSGYLTGTKRGRSAIELAAEKAHVFWETLQQLRLGKDSTNTYNNMVFTVYNPPYNTHEELPSNSEKIYDELSYLMYDIQDLTRQHIHYLNNMDVKAIQIETENSSLLNSYQNHIDIIPLECVTMYTIMDIMLHTIDAAFADNAVRNSRSSLTSAETLIQVSSVSNNDLEKAETLVDKVFATLSKNDLDKKKYRLTCGELYDKFENPVIINYGDSAKLTNFHLENFNIDDFILSSLINMPFCKLWKNQTILSDELKAKVNFHINNLLSCFDREDMDDSLLNRLIHILSFRKLYNNRSSLRNETIPPNTISEFKKMYLKRSMFAEPLLKSTSFCNASATTPSNPLIVKSDSYCKEFSNEIETEEESIKFLFSCPDLSELVSAAEISNNKPLIHFIDEFDYFEDFNGINALQMLFEAFGKFNCLNYKYCEVTDSFEIMFFNDHNEEGISREEWRCHLPTPVCLQDFYDFVFEEQFDWIQEEEKLYDEITAQKTKLEWKESLDQVPVKTCIENIDEIDSELLIIGSLKYKERFPFDYISNEEVDQDQSLSKSHISTPLTEPDTRGIQKTKQSKKQIRETLIEFNADVISDDNQYSKPFSGYNLGNRRVEVFGRDSVYFCKDGSKVSTFYTITIPINLEHLTLNVALGNGHNEFCMHKTLGDTKSFNYTCNLESFRIHGKDQVITYLKKNLYEVPIDRVTTHSLKTNNVKESVHKINVKQSTSTNTQAIRSESYNSFIISWPNGLIIESVHETTSPAISHIKQHFITPPPHIFEHMRCVTLNGEVIIFKKSGCVEVFRPDGTFINITKCSKKAVDLETTEDIQSNVSSDKGKSKKGKSNKSKDKLRGAISKASKATLDQNQVPEIPLQFDFVIDEFEITDVNGLKQTFIDNHVVSSEKVLIRTAVDYCLGEVLSRRMDGTTLLLNKDGVQVTTFHDNTRVITTCIVEEQEIYSESNDSNVVLTESNTFESNKVSKSSLSQKSKESVANSLKSNTTLDIQEQTVKTGQNRDDGFVSVQIVHTVEHSNFATIVINKAKGSVNVESANKANLTIDTANNFHFYLDESTSATFDGKYLDVISKACHLCNSNSKFKIKIDDTQSDSDINQCWLSMRDSFGKNIVVDDEGGINLVEQQPYKEEANIRKGETDAEDLSETCLTLQGKCRELYEANMFRFFVLNRNLTCSELVHNSMVDEYKSQCRWQPWCSINEYNTFGDHRTLISILTPVPLTQTEKCLMQSKYSNKPKQLKYKDLREDSGKGFYHWMRPYERFQPQPTEVDNLELPKLPRAYVLRTLEQLWNEEVREKFKGGKEIVAAVLRYRKLMESDSQTILNVPIRDPRTEDEKAIDEKLQDIAQSIYNDLKNKIADEIQASAQPTIMTETSSVPQFLIGDRGEVTCDELKKNWEEKSAAYVSEVEEVDKPSPNLERYWRRRTEEAREEEFYKQLLREESIPPYFRNILGGAAWSEVDRVAGDAVARAQPGPCICVKPHTKEIHEESHNTGSQ